MEKDEAGRIGALRAREGRVHSMETMGTVDGPGTRLVVFCQGCPMRCAYCPVSYTHLTLPTNSRV